MNIISSKFPRSFQSGYFIWLKCIYGHRFLFHSNCFYPKCIKCNGMSFYFVEYGKLKVLCA